MYCLDFDDADFSEGCDPDAHPDEVILPASATSRQFGSDTMVNGHPRSARPIPNDSLPRQMGNGQAGPKPMPAPARPQPNVVINGNAPNNRPIAQQQQQQPQLPQTPHSGLSRATSVGNAGAQMRPPQDVNVTSCAPQNGLSGPLVGPAVGPPRVLNQPSRAGPPSGPSSPVRAHRLLPISPEKNKSGLPSALPPGIEPPGFFSARGVQAHGEGTGASGKVSNIPAFNPKAESPSIRKTPGIDHTATMPLTRDLKHIPRASQASTSDASPTVRGNVVNPHLDVTRRVGAPGSPSPMANRNSYKPPTMKRPSNGPPANEQRSVLGDLPANGPLSADIGGDNKRQKVGDF